MDNSNKTFQTNLQLDDKNNFISKIPKGDLLEFRLKRLIFYMGYIPKKGILIKTDAYESSDTITDLDVYGLYFHKNFALKTIWADCKSGNDKPLERISWLLGVKNSLNIDDIIYVKKGVRLSTSEYARKRNIQVLDLNILDELEKNFNIEFDDWRGSWNPNTQYKQINILKSIKIINPDISKKIINFITTNYWSLDYYTQIKKTITALKQISRIDNSTLSYAQNQSLKWVIYELITLFSISTLNICREVFYYSKSDKLETIRNGLISGIIPVEKREEIVKATYTVAYSIIQRKAPDFNDLKLYSKIGFEPPQYYEAFYDLIIRITSNPNAYFDILRGLDFILMEYDLQNKEVDLNIVTKLFSNYDDMKIGIKTILHFICNVTGISTNLFNILK